MIIALRCIYYINRSHIVTGKTPVLKAAKGIVNDQSRLDTLEK